MKNICEQVEKNIDELVNGGVGFSIPVTHEEIEEFKKTHKISSGQMFMPPPEWIADNISGMKILYATMTVNRIFILPGISCRLFRMNTIKAAPMPVGSNMVIRWKVI